MRFDEYMHVPRMELVTEVSLRLSILQGRNRPRESK